MEQDQATRNEKRQGGVMGGIVLITLGALFLLDNFIPGFRFKDYWPVLFIAIGIGILIKARRPR